MAQQDIDELFEIFSICTIEYFENDERMTKE
jgi:hypothetical protein